jgi:hypothetical protein
MTSELRRLHGSFVDDNPLLYASLGLLSSFETLERILTEHAPEGRVPPPTEADEPAPRADADGVDFLLGLIAFRERVRAHLLAAALPDADGSPRTVHEEPFESFLR